MSSEPVKRELGKLIKFPRIQMPRRNDEELEFLPAALELIETPASPLGRVMMWTIIALATVALLWACFGKVDIIATAPGRVIPSGQIKLIQPFEIGVVKAIHVADGDGSRHNYARVTLKEVVCVLKSSVAVIEIGVRAWDSRPLVYQCYIQKSISV